VKQGATLKRLDLETPQWVKDLTVSGR